MSTTATNLHFVSVIYMVRVRLKIYNCTFTPGPMVAAMLIEDIFSTGNAANKARKFSSKIFELEETLPIT